MNRKKIKAIIALTLSLCYFNVTFAEPVRAFSSVISQAQSPRDQYESFIKTKLNLQAINFTACENAPNNLDSNNASASNSKESFKLFLAENEKGFLLTPTINSDKNEFLLPTSSFLNQNSLILSPSENIETLSLFFDNSQTISYSNLNKDCFYNLFNLNTTSSLNYALIKYKNDEKIYKQVFSFIKDNTNPLITNIKKAYRIENFKPILRISWEESDDHLFNDINYKKIYYNNALLDVSKASSNNSYYCDLPIDNLTSNGTFHILTCDSTYQINDTEGEFLGLPNFNYSDETIISDNLEYGMYTIKFPFNKNVKDVTVNANNEVFTLDSNNNSVSIPIIQGGTYEVNFTVNLISNESYTFSKKYIYDDEPLILDNVTYQSRIYEDYGETPIIKENIIKNGDTIFYDGTTINKERNVFPLNVSGNKDLKDLSIKVNGQPIVDKATDFTQELKLNASSNLISIAATDNSGYVDELTFKVELAEKDYNFNISTDSGTIIKANATDYEISSNKSFNLKANLVDYPYNLIKENLTIEAFDNNQRPLNLDYYIKQNQLTINNISSNYSKISIKYLDKFNRLVTSNISINVDTTNPIITSELSSTEVLNLSGLDKLKIIVLDNSLYKNRTINLIPNLSTNLNNSFCYELLDEGSNPVNLALSTDAVTANKFERNLSINLGTGIKALNLPDGEYTLKCKYVDNVNNSSEIYSRKIIIDNTNPIIKSNLSNSLFKDSVSIEKDGDYLLFNDEKVISIEDINFDNFEYKVYKTSGTSQSEVSNSNLNTSGDYILSVFCRDKAGNTATLNDFKFSLDCDKPLIDASNNAPNLFNDSYYYKNGIFTLKLDDNYMDFNQSIYSGIESSNANSVYVSLSSTTKPYNNLFDINKCIGPDFKELKFDIDQLNLKDDEYKLSVKVIDKVGHITTNDYTLIVDKTAPSITTNEQYFKDKGNLENLNYYLFNNSVTISTTISKLINSDNKNNHITSIDEKNFKKGNIRISKLKPNSKSEEVENIDLDPMSINNYYKILKEGIYTISYCFEDITGNKTEHSITFAVVSTPKINFGYLDSTGEFIDLKDVKYTKNDFSPVIKVEGLLNGKLKQCNITRTYLDDLNNVKKEDFNENNFTTTSNIDEYGNVYYKLGSNVDNAFKFTTLKDGEINYDFTFSSFFGEDTTLSNRIFIEKELPYVSATLNGLPTENQINYINTAPKFKINISKNYSSLKINYPSFVIKKLNGDGSEIDVSYKFEAINLNNANYSSEFEIRLKSDTVLDENGVYMVSYKVDTKADNSITKNFNFSYDTYSPSYSIKAVNNKVDTDLNMDSNGNCYSNNVDTSLKVEFNDNSFNFNQLLADVSRLSNNVIVKKAGSEEVIFNSNNLSSNSIIVNSNIFTEGCYDITISSTDAAKNSFTKTIKYYLDYTKPNIEFKNPPISTKGTTYYFKDNFKPNFIINDATPLDTITINYSLNGMNYSCTADKFNEDLLENINVLKENIINKNELKFELIINGHDKAGNEFFRANEEFRCILVLDSTMPKTIISVDDTIVTNLKDKIFDAIPKDIKLVIDDSNLNIDNIQNDFKVRYLSTISNEPQKDVLTSSSLDVKFVYDDNIKGYVATIPYSGDGYYYIETAAKDYSENLQETSATFFTIDTTNISSAIESKDDSFNLSKKYYNNSINLSLNVAGHYSGFEECKYSLIRDGVDVTKDFLISDFNSANKGGSISFSLPKDTSLEGTYTLAYSLVGNVGGKNQGSIEFVIDKTAPTLYDFNLNMGNGKVVNNIFYTNAPNANVKFNAQDAYTSVKDLIKTVSINGTNYNLTDTSVPNSYISADGKYNISFGLTDYAGNTSSYSYDIILDRVSPNLTVNGFNGTTCAEDQEFYINQNITPQISVADTNGEDIEARNITLDSSTYSSTTITSNGKHVYKVRVKDYAGNFSEFEKTFILDTVFPVISIEDVVSNAYYNKDVLPRFTVDDINAKLSAYLNNINYDSSIIKDDGIYELVIKAVDRALNTTEIKIPFTIDKIAPIISIKGILENQVNGGSVAPVITANEAQALITALLNGEEYLGFVITDSGKYNLIVRAVDLAGNVAQKVVSFIVDSTLPQITVDGLEDGKEYTGAIHPKISASKNAKLEFLLNGKPYDGSEISDVGEYELKIIATDEYSNKSEAIYKFSIVDESKPAASSNVNSSSKDTTSPKKDNKNFLTNNLLPISVTAVAIVALIIGVVVFAKIKKGKKPEQ